MKKILLISLFPVLMFFTACGGDDGKDQLAAMSKAAQELQARLKAATEQLALTESQRAAAQKGLEDAQRIANEGCRGIADSTRDTVTASMVALSNVSDESTRNAINTQLLAQVLANRGSQATGIAQCQEALTQSQQIFAGLQGVTQGLFDSKKALEATIKDLIARYVIPQAIASATAATTSTGQSSTQGLVNLLSLGSQASTAVRGMLANNPSASRFADVAGNLAAQGERSLKKATVANVQALANESARGGQGIAGRSVGSSVNSSTAASNTGLRTMKTTIPGTNSTVSVVY